MPAFIPGTAIASDVRAGKNFSSGSLNNAPGSLVVQTGGAVTPGPSAITKAAGIYDTDIVVAGVTVPAGSVRAGVTIAGTAGALAVQATAAQTVTPGTSDIVKAAGIYDGAITIAGSPDGIASNIRTGKVINGVAGTLVEGTRWAEGNFYTSNGVCNVTGLVFTPGCVIVKVTGISSGYYITCLGIGGKWIWARRNGSGAIIDSGQFDGSGFVSGGFSVTIPNVSTLEVLSWTAFERVPS
jgi:hypothetical protein